MQFCSKCGKQLADDAVFCSACGQATNSTPSQPAEQPSVQTIPPRDLQQERSDRRKRGGGITVGVLLILAGVAVIIGAICLVMAQL